jgi:hypothetical protein
MNECMYNYATRQSGNSVKVGPVVDSIKQEEEEEEAQQQLC